ncbi:cleavage and polyadenylation specificity factor subunit 4 [Kwoniella heveanensis CBS 569]|nr:cleavage and polyadenylation specificity factor subunit 4 [Kwoniella heveanensis CBS 569]
MSVPLPSPSPLSPPTNGTGNGNGAPSGLSSAKPIPRSKPTPISTNSPKNSPSSPSGSSFRNRPNTGVASSISRSYLNDDNWRDRSPGPASSSLSGLNTAVPASAKSGGGSGSNKGPERTVGGFEKREIKSAGLGGAASGISGLSREKEKVEKKDKGKDQDKAKDLDADKADKANLSHVPCRFFKAGACTAGDSCPFSHAAPDAAKREVCQWFLKGNCKFGHKCALAHVRPGEPMSMDRKNKKAAQLEARERSDSVGASNAPPAPSSGAATGMSLSESPRPTGIPRGRKNSSSIGDDHASPVPIKSALSSSMQSPSGGRLPSSPLREPFGPPSGALPNSPNSAGFAHGRPHAAAAFASSPSRPSPLSASFGASGSVPGPLSLKASASNPLGSPLRPPVTAAAAFSSSFSHSSLDRAAQAGPLSASFAGDGGNLHKSIWARSDTPAEPLSPRRPIPRTNSSREDAVFIDEEDHGEDFLPSSLSDLLTPRERARRMSRRDSQGGEEFAQSPSKYASPLWSGGERLAQSAGATMGPGGFLQSLWSAEGEDARKHRSEQEDGVAGAGNGNGNGQGDGFAFGPSATQPPARKTSLLTQQRSPTSAISPTSPNRQIPSSRQLQQQIDQPYLIRNLGDPSSPSARALQEHAPGQSLPGGIASALSRLHLHGPRSPSGLGAVGRADDEISEGGDELAHHGLAGKKVGGTEDHDEGLFAMDG